MLSLLSGQQRPFSERPVSAYLCLMPHTFFAPDLTELTTYTLPEDESKHAVRVLRLSMGDAVVLVNGRGGVFGAEVADANPKRCQLRVVHSAQVPPRSFRVHLAVAPTKNLDRMEWLVEKATEIGVDTITFLRCARSERRDLKLERLEKIAVSALKQSGQAWLPQLTELTDYARFLPTAEPATTFIAHLEDGERTSLSRVAAAEPAAASSSARRATSPRPKLRPPSPWASGPSRWAAPACAPKRRPWRPYTPCTWPGSWQGSIFRRTSSALQRVTSANLRGHCAC